MYILLKLFMNAVYLTTVLTGRKRALIDAFPCKPRRSVVEVYLLACGNSLVKVNEVKRIDRVRILLLE